MRINLYRSGYLTIKYPALEGRFVKVMDSLYQLDDSFVVSTGCLSKSFVSLDDMKSYLEEVLGEGVAWVSEEGKIVIGSHEKSFKWWWTKPEINGQIENDIVLEVDPWARRYLYRDRDIDSDERVYYRSLEDLRNSLEELDCVDGVSIRKTDFC